MGAFFGFRKMVSTSIIKLIYFLGIIGITILGILGMAGVFVENENGAGYVLGGLLIIIFGNLVWRIFCEGWILLFSIHKMLGSIEKALAGKGLE